MPSYLRFVTSQPSVTFFRRSIHFLLESSGENPSANIDRARSSLRRIDRDSASRSSARRRLFLGGKKSFFGLLNFVKIQRRDLSRNPPYLPPLPPPLGDYFRRMDFSRNSRGVAEVGEISPETTDRSQRSAFSVPRRWKELPRD